MSPTPELILCNAEVRTQDPGQPRARALAIAGGRITAVGDDVTILGLAGRGTRRLDLEGRLVLPGFMDSHFHFYDWSLYQDLAGVSSFQGLETALAAAVAQEVPGGWVLGQGFNETDWPDGRIPEREDLDRVTGDVPTVIWRCDLHLAVANTAALARAGLIGAGIDGPAIPDPPGGVIARDGTGRPTGVLRETAINLVKDCIPQVSDGERLRAMEQAQERLHACGITALHDLRLKGERDAPRAMRLFQRLDREGRLAMRTWVSLPGERLDEAVALGLTAGFGSERLRLGHVKYFADGGMGARTASVLEPYLDAGCGLSQMGVGESAAVLRTAEQAGLAVMIHAVGDRAVSEVISAFEVLQEWRSSPEARDVPSPPLMHRIDHLQMVRPHDLARLARLKVAVGMQPSNMVLDFNLIDRCLGDKGRYAYTFRSVLESGIPTLFNSDCPVSDPRPLMGIHALVTRQRPDSTPEGGWYPEQRISVEQAVAGYTSTPALAYGVAQQGRIGPGMLADLAVLDRNIFAIEPREIQAARVDLTLFNGRIVYERPGA
ncbi:MAG: amidohydrolase [Desulfohalobiaceae bacterium]